MNRQMILRLLFCVLLSAGTTLSASDSGGHYTCAMHPGVKEPEGGKCPICNMNLAKSNMSSVKESDVADFLEDYYTCSMHPGVKEFEEGKCPICNMNLTRVSPSAASEGVGSVTLSNSQSAHFSPSFIKAESRSLTKTLSYLGRVRQSRDSDSTIAARFGGRIERLHIASAGLMVREGDALFAVYSPDIITAGEEYIISRRSYESSRNKDLLSLMNDAASRLESWGVDDSQYLRWYESGKVPAEFPVYSRQTGVVEKVLVSDGHYIKSGTELFKIFDMSNLWLEVDVFEQEADLIKLGQTIEVEIMSRPGEKRDATIDFVSPFLDEKSRTMNVRAIIRNTRGKLKPGMTGRAMIKVLLDEKSVVIPKSAVIDTGGHKLVWTRGVKKNSFVAKEIFTGHEADGLVIVKAGLDAGVEVVSDGNFLLDAQTKLFGGYKFPKTGDSASDESGHSCH